MRAYCAFVKKELMEQLRTYKCLIVLSVFFLFGMLSPLTAKLLPDILSGIEMQGMVITIPEPTQLDAYGQFFKNLSQIGILVLLLVFGGTLTNELVKGTLVNILAKGLSRTTVILSKFTAAVLLWTIGYLLAALTAYGYTEYLFPDSWVSNLTFAMFCLWIFGLFILALILLSSTLIPINFGGLILSGVTIVAMLLLDIYPKTHFYNPITLASDQGALLSGATKVKDLYITIIITVIFTLGCLIGSTILFRKKKL